MNAPFYTVRIQQLLRHWHHEDLRNKRKLMSLKYYDNNNNNFFKKENVGC